MKSHELQIPNSQLEDLTLIEAGSQTSPVYSERVGPAKDNVYLSILLAEKVIRESCHRLATFGRFEYETLASLYGDLSWHTEKKNSRYSAVCAVNNTSNYAPLSLIS